MGTCCETICKYRILFPSIQHLAWLLQGRLQGIQKCGKNSKNINLRRYFKFNREDNCNTSIQTFMSTATLCNLCYIVVCCELLVNFSDKKSCNTSTTLQNSARSLSAIAELLVWYWFSAPISAWYVCQWPKYSRDAFDEVHFCLVADACQICIHIQAFITRVFPPNLTVRNVVAASVVVMPVGITRASCQRGQQCTDASYSPARFKFYYTVSQEVYPLMFGNNFGKICGLIFKILSPIRRNILYVACTPQRFPPHLYYVATLLCEN